MGCIYVLILTIDTKQRLRSATLKCNVIGDEYIYMCRPIPSGFAHTNLLQILGKTEETIPIVFSKWQRCLSHSADCHELETRS